MQLWAFVGGIVGCCMPIVSSTDPPCLDWSTPRQQDNPPVPKILATISTTDYILDDKPIHIVWQEGDAIWIKTCAFGSNFDCVCSDPSEVYRTAKFLTTANSGLSDVASARGYSWNETVVVAWLLEGSVWYRYVQVSPFPWKAFYRFYRHNMLPCYRAHGPEQYDRVEVRLVTFNPDGNRYDRPVAIFLVWSSWNQDLDGWGIFATSLTEGGAHKEVQMNQYWKHHQSRPEVIRCGDGAWVAWMNSTDSCDDPDAAPFCATGPFVRELYLTDFFKNQTNKSLPPEANLQLDRSRGPLSVAMNCYDSYRTVEVFTLYSRGRRAGAEIDDRVVPSLTGPRRMGRAEANGRALAESRTASWLGSTLASLQAMVFDAGVPFRMKPMSRSERDASAFEFDTTWPVSMTSEAGKLALWYIDPKQATLKVQLKEYPSGQVYAPKTIAVGAQSAYAKWSFGKVYTGDDYARQSEVRQVLIVCWVTQNTQCIAREVDWLKAPDVNWLELGVLLVLILIIGGILITCCFRYRFLLRRRIGHVVANPPQSPPTGTRELSQACAASLEMLEASREAPSTRPEE